MKEHVAGELENPELGGDSAPGLDEDMSELVDSEQVEERTQVGAASLGSVDAFQQSRRVGDLADGELDESAPCLLYTSDAADE